MHGDLFNACLFVHDDELLSTAISKVVQFVGIVGLERFGNEGVFCPHFQLTIDKSS